MNVSIPIIKMLVYSNIDDESSCPSSLSSYLNLITPANNIFELQLIFTIHIK